MTTAAIAPADTEAHERRITVALFAAGLTTFASMYSAQALLPSLSAEFGATPASAALAVSLTTGLLAVAIVPMSVLSDRFGRTRVMIGSAGAAAVIGLVLPFSPTLDVLLTGRAIQGVVLAGVPAVAMAYLAEEIGAAGLGSAMGIYVAGTSLGGLTGRLIPAFTLEVGSWRWGLAAIGVAAAVCAGIFVRMVPPSRRFDARRLEIGRVAADFAGHLRDRTLLPLFGLAFVMMGGFVSVYNFLGYRLTRAPFGLSAATVGLVFVLYLAGTATAANAGRMTNRLGRSRVLTLGLIAMGIGLLLTLPDMLPIILLGVLLCTAGFFAVHAVASGWVGAAATGNRAAASALYLCAYYLGSSIAGGVGGLAYGHFGWTGLAAYVAVLVVLAGGLVATLTTR
ncbi:MFS transporter [Nocardia sp. SYP-A9097]|uniref:MFS transporter n=1 Tax=Nocardia sp. SYP-A9097 TaxID=2663237 RepID=UPI00129BCE1A|nr:MFS transporter [Nocardia sp. SYP-A9097]MRH89543.1 MFS transporter [Nocardia sp. SYP-A9097]